jgi:hypothetical protein
MQAPDHRMKEIRDVKQVAGEPPRRWFFSHEQDLLVWFGNDGIPVAFQLAYGKYRNEHALRWNVDRGFTHHRVDDGEDSALAKGAPMLFPNGAFKAEDVLQTFLALSIELPREIVEFVAGQLKAHPEYSQRA